MKQILIVAGCLLVFTTAFCQQQMVDSTANKIPVISIKKAVPAKQSSVLAAPARYQIPKGNIFCRMEDYMCRTTGVWLKVGVK